MIGSTAIATGILRLAVAIGTGGRVGGSFLFILPFAFAFGSDAGRSGWVSVVVTFAASSSSFAHWSSLTLRVFSLSLVGVGKRGGVIAEFLLVVGQVIELEVWVLLETAVSI